MEYIYAELKGKLDKTITDLQAKVEAMEATRGVGGNRHDGNIYNYKSFTRMQKFTGDANEWSGWLFNLKVCSNTMDEEFGEAVLAVTQAKIDKEKVQTMMAVVPDSVDSEPYKLGKQFCEVLCGPTIGEANVIVRSTAEKFGSCGFGALYLLNKRYRPNTHARKIQCLTEVVRPQIIKDSRQLVMAVELWEGKVAALLRDFQQDFGRWD